MAASVVGAAGRVAAAHNLPCAVVWLKAPGDLLPEPREALDLAQQFQMQQYRISAERWHEQITEIVHQAGVSMIAVARPSRSGGSRLSRNLPGRLRRTFPLIDLYEVSPITPTVKREPMAMQIQRFAISVMLALAVVVLTLGICYTLRSIMGTEVVVLLMVLAVALTALFTGPIESFITSIIGGLGVNLVFVAPTMGIIVDDKRSWLTVAVLVIVSLMISILSLQAKQQAKESSRFALKINSLYELSRRLLQANQSEEITTAVSDHLTQTSQLATKIVLRPAGISEEEWEEQAVQTLGEKMRSAIRFSIKTGAPSGPGTSTEPAAPMRLQPVKGKNEVLGLIAITSVKGLGIESFVDPRLLEGISDQMAIAWARVRLTQENDAARIAARSAEMQNILLRSITHDLRTPLTSIVGSSARLADGDQMDEEARQNLMNTIAEDAVRLEGSINNVLEITKLESGLLERSMEPVAVEEAVGIAIRQMRRALRSRTVDIDLPDDLPEVTGDLTLLAQAIGNLIQNGARFAGAGGCIWIKAKLVANAVQIAVTDSGPGIPEGQEKKIFEKFYRAPGGVGAGTGLGLAIVRTIAEMHHGRTWAENSEEGGARFTLEIPVAPTNSEPK